MIHKALQGDNDARSRLYHQYSQPMYNICIRMTGNAQNARDILQNAFILAFTHLKQVKSPDRFAGWLRKIVINECIRFSKAALPVQALDDNLDAPLMNEEVPWWTEVDLATINRAITDLPEGCRQVFVLFALEDFTHKEIAASLGISESTSKSQYQRARKLLRDMILKKSGRHG
jgi:RNA polymerase sigma-70 factor (ECF subfamily)